jgi:HPt (histidine-containing phosphotransfer) domain-containing protein
MDEAEDEILDRARLAAIRAELGGNFVRLFGYFLEDGEKSIATIELAMLNRSAVALVRPAHMLKGDALQFGAERLGLAAEVIEKAARYAVEARDFPNGIQDEVDRLRPLFAQSLFQIRQVIAPPSPMRRAIGFGRKVAAAHG